MNEFGKSLRNFRNRCNDPENLDRRLSQERFGELIGRELGVREGFSGAAVSDWERGKSKIHADHRLVLISLLAVLYEQGGIESVAEANQLLESGNYRSLDSSELKQIFPRDVEFPVSPSNQKMHSNFAALLLGEELFLSEEELQTRLTKAKEGPLPAWPRIFVALLRTMTDRWSVIRVLQALGWAWVWLVTWGTIMPSLRWPFASQGHAKTVIVLYAGATMFLPLLIGLFTNTRNNEFWQNHNLADATITRLYTYQGAFVGFHLGFFAAFAIGLLRYNLQLPLTLWFELILMLIPVIVAYMGARLVPHNLWQAYRRLSLADGGIFFFFIVVGPLWGFFFWKFYPVILTPFTGGLVILFAITLLAILMTWQYRRTNTTVIPFYWWLILFGAMTICQIIGLFLQ